MAAVVVTRRYGSVGSPDINFACHSNYSYPSADQPVFGGPSLAWFKGTGLQRTPIENYAQTLPTQLMSSDGQSTSLYEL